MTLEELTIIAAPVERCFDLSRSVEVHLAGNVHWGESAMALGGVTTGLIGMGQRVTWRARHFAVWHSLASEITAMDPPSYFQDTMVRGPFRSMQHDPMRVDPWWPSATSSEVGHASACHAGRKGRPVFSVQFRLSTVPRYTLEMRSIPLFLIAFLSASAQTPDWPQVNAEAMRHFQTLIQIDSFIVAANIIALLRGNGARRPLLIVGHSDTVKVDASKWIFPPFSGARNGVGAMTDLDDATKGFGAHSDQERILEEAVYKHVQFFWTAVTSIAGTKR